MRLWLNKLMNKETNKEKKFPIVTARENAFSPLNPLNMNTLMFKNLYINNIKDLKAKEKYKVKYKVENMTKVENMILAHKQAYQEIYTCLQKHEAYLTAVKKDVIEKHHFEPTEYLLYFEELLRFFYISKLLKHTPMLSKEVDIIWHQMILYTENYAEFCIDFNDKMIHHRPRTLEDVSDLSQVTKKKDANEEVDEFILLYLLFFGIDESTLNVYPVFLERTVKVVVKYLYNLESNSNYFSLFHDFWGDIKNQEMINILDIKYVSSNHHILPISILYLSLQFFYFDVLNANFNNSTKELYQNFRKTLRKIKHKHNIKNEDSEVPLFLFYLLSAGILEKTLLEHLDKTYNYEEVAHANVNKSDNVLIGNYDYELISYYAYTETDINRKSDQEKEDVKQIKTAYKNKTLSKENDSSSIFSFFAGSNNSSSKSSMTDSNESSYSICSSGSGSGSGSGSSSSSSSSSCSSSSSSSSCSSGSSSSCSSCSS